MTATAAHPASLVPLGFDRWRVVTGSGVVAGLVEELVRADGVRYRARRYRWASHAFVDVGEFWRRDDAVAVLCAG